MKFFVLAAALIFATRNLHAETAVDFCARALARASDRDQIIFVKGKAGPEARISTHDGWPDSGLQAGVSPEIEYPTDVRLGWLYHLGKDVIYSRHEEPGIPETYEDFIVSPNQLYSVSYSNYGHTRVYGEDRKARPPLEYAGHTAQLQDGVLAVSDTYFVLGQRRKFADGSGEDVLTLRRLDAPETVIWSYAVNAKLTSLLLDREERRLVFTTAKQVFLFDIEMWRNTPMFVSFPAENLEISTAALLTGGSDLLLGFRNLDKDPKRTYILNINLDDFTISAPAEIEGMKTVLSIASAREGELTVQGPGKGEPVFKTWAEVPETSKLLTHDVLPLPYPAPE